MRTLIARKTLALPDGRGVGAGYTFDIEDEDAAVLVARGDADYREPLLPSAKPPESG